MMQMPLLRSLAFRLLPASIVVLVAASVHAQIAAPQALKPFSIYNGHPPRTVVGESLVRGGRGKAVLDPVLQGDVVHHEVKIVNDSDTPWTLENLQVCSGCMLNGWTKIIGAGETGSIAFVIPTDAWGGQTLEGTIQADTNAAAPSQLAIDVELEIREFAALDPYRLWLKGSASESIQETCLVVPNADYPFSITGIKTRKGVWIEHEVRKTEHEGQLAYAIDVRNTRKKPGPYQDVLFVQTDHPERPEFKIRIEGRIE
ncbi:MAG: hypothetical protein QF570_05140 [Myxococcota bacterium]|jgi:hypothetical protein|nr:hypothetical protein [Myxococcota bacterium]